MRVPSLHFRGRCHQGTSCKIEQPQEAVNLCVSPAEVKGHLTALFVPGGHVAEPPALPRPWRCSGYLQPKVGPHSVSWRLLCTTDCEALILIGSFKREKAAWTRGVQEKLRCGAAAKERLSSDELWIF